MFLPNYKMIPNAGNVTAITPLQFSADIGPLLLAIVATIGLILPSLLKWYRRPIFSIDFSPFELDTYDSSTIDLKIKNLGRSVAHKCRINIDIVDSKRTKLMSLYLPWIKQDPKDVEAGLKPPGITYKDIDLYPTESAYVKFLFFFYRNYGGGDLGLSVFGSFHSWLYYGEYGLSKGAEPPLSELQPLYDPVGDSPVIKNDEIYEIDLHIYSEEKSELKTKKIYFKINNNGIWGGESDKSLILLINFKTT